MAKGDYRGVGMLLSLSCFNFSYVPITAVGVIASAFSPLSLPLFQLVAVSYTAVRLA